MGNFQQTQLAFIEHLKDPDKHEFDHGIEDRRLQIYRDLFFNNVLGFLSSGFPVLESIYTAQNWRALARAFFAQHQCRSPYFTDISKEFVEFLSNEYQPLETDPPFLAELAHYEWLELAISVRKTENQLQVWNGDTLPDSVIFSELAELVSYQFPVHQIRPDFQPQESAEPVYLVVYRNLDDEVNFTLVNPVSAHMLMLVKSQHMPLHAIVEQMQSALPQILPQQVEQGTKDSIQTLLNQQILLPVFA